ncbi:amidohydrolase family protein [Sphingomonas lenta]|uniref:Amidohydrolase n=1 Tax=Sphingomonas lenta TaxID=1141887 RepID=A0A2A2SHM0_9SPHN|nr:amidohydrolase family protein [Sphingomonas lenta]PAX08718.1 amidohydrolase [Sphingomonas lenta]
MIRRRAALLAALLFSTAPAHAHEPARQAAAPAAPSTADLLVPPADAQRYVVVSQAGEHGTAAAWRLPDGSLAHRFSMNLRGQLFELDQTTRLGANGLPERIVVRGFTPGGDAGELFEVRDGVARWRNKVENASAPFDGRAFYSAYGGPWSANAIFAEALYRAPNRTLRMLPSGEARMVKLVDVPVGGGATAKTVTAWSIEGLGLEPLPVLLNQDGSFFAFVVYGMGMLPREYAGDLLKIQRAQIDALTARSPEIARRFGQVSPVPVAFTNVRMFDAEGKRFVGGQTVVTNGRTIAAVGPAASVRVPANARVIDGRGKTLTPGLWDAHMHVGSDRQGLMLLSMGETSARDPGANVQATELRRKRVAAGQLLFPTVYSSVLIDGKGPLQAQGGLSVSSVEETLAAVRRAKDSGFTGVKFYTSMKPEWLWAGVAEAKRLGLHVHGHIPATLRAKDVIARGYDEITHINFVMMQALPDSVVDVSNGIARFEGPGRYAKDVDLDAEPMRSLVAEMARRGTVVDPTLVTFEGLYVPENGDLSPAYAPFVGTMPPQAERGFREGGFKPPAGVTRADYRASFAKLVQLTKKLHDANVPIVAGTDGGGLELVRELELYVRAGMTPAQALATATIAPARLAGVGGTTGSIAVGKEADLVLVDGDVSAEIGALRRTQWVMSDGALMNADELRRAAGFSGAPK